MGACCHYHFGRSAGSGQYTAVNQRERELHGRETKIQAEPADPGAPGGRLHGGEPPGLYRAERQLWVREEYSYERSVDELQKLHKEKIQENQEPAIQKKRCRGVPGIFRS